MQFLKIPFRERWWRHALSAPFIFGMLIPIFFLDICLELYHRICFPLYQIPCVHRGEYILIDRHKLSYLNGLQKLYCVYCGYGNGVLRYAARIAADTETYFCGIRHRVSGSYREPPHHKNFLPYGDAQALQNFIKEKNN